LAKLSKRNLSKRNDMNPKTAYNNVAVFCGSRDGINPEFKVQADRLGRLLADKKVRIIYGGGNIGLMGFFSSAARNQGAEITSVIPEAFIKPSKLSRESNEHIVARDLFERKKTMLDIADIAIVMPGGIGTFDETFEVLALNDLAKYSAPNTQIKPIIIMNIAGYFDWLVSALENAIQEGFMDVSMKTLIKWAKSADEAVQIFSALNDQPIPSVRTLIPS
jgi:uncharacterized protein (TIGR00730 family)